MSLYPLQSPPRAGSKHGRKLLTQDPLHRPLHLHFVGVTFNIHDNRASLEHDTSVTADSGSAVVRPATHRVVRHYPFSTVFPEHILATGLTDTEYLLVDHSALAVPVRTPRLPCSPRARG